MARVLMATGGTGGHVFPAMALAAELEDKVTLHFAGAKLASNRYFDQQAFPYTEIKSGAHIYELLPVCQGILQSLKLLKALSPQVVVGFGSYHSFPVLAAARLLRLPMILWAADSIPGKVIRWFSPYAQMTAIQFPAAAAHLKGATQLSAMPLRQGYFKQAIDRRTALNHYRLPGAKPVCLVFGGSQGARYLNEAVPEALQDFEVLHITGSEASVPCVAARYQSLGVTACVLPFESEMQRAWCAADIACLRAGAVTLAEQLAFEVPALLIPFPFAMEDHQTKNAEYIASLNLGIMLKEGSASATEMGAVLKKLLQSSSERQSSFQAYKQKGGVKTLKELVMERL